MASSFVKFNQFVADCANKVHNLSLDACYILLTNTAPNAADTVVDTTTSPCTIKSTSNAVECAAGNGYTKGGNAATVVSSTQSGGVYKLVLSSPTTWTATGGSLATLRYAVLYNSTAGTAATRPVIGYWDYGSSITPAVGETFQASLDGTNGVLQLT